MIIFERFYGPNLTLGKKSAVFYWIEKTLFPHFFGMSLNLDYIFYDLIFLNWWKRTQNVQ